MNRSPILQVQDVRVHFPVKGAKRWPWQPYPLLKAVDGVSFDLYPGETLGVVGESGCGKSTLARAVVGLVKATSGKILWQGGNIIGLEGAALKAVRKEIQMIFQDPLASLNPRMTVGDIIAEPLRNYFPNLSADEVNGQVREMMDRVGLLPNVINRYPHEFSGGQCQRIGIARALILKPKLVICDEPVSALDVSIQAQVVNLLKELQQQMGLSLIFIAHDLSVIKHISDRVLVLYLGNEMELAEAEQLYSDPRHPYTRALMSAVPIPDPRQERNKRIELLEGDLPSPIKPPQGCVFNTRCSVANDNCRKERPALRQLGEQHFTSCIKEQS